jgi:hypothetical protein
LVVARLFARCVFVIRLKNYQLFLVLDIPVCLVPPPQRVWRGKSIEGKMRFDILILGWYFVMRREGIAV